MNKDFRFDEWDPETRTKAALALKAVINRLRVIDDYKKKIEVLYD